MADAVILGFQNFKFLTAAAVKRMELHQRAKFRQNRSNRSRDIRIFRFFQDGGRSPSWICSAGGDHPRRAFGGLYHCAKFGWNRCSSFHNMHVFRFCEFGLKTPIHAPKLGVFTGKIGDGVEWYWPPTNSFLLLGVYTSVSNLVKINEEMRPWECPQTDRHTYAQTQNDFIICPMLYAIAMGQIININNCHFWDFVKRAGPAIA